jgi:hypothetical protein
MEVVRRSGGGAQDLLRYRINPNMVIYVHDICFFLSDIIFAIQ